jgi:hypothetical protein
MHVRLDPIDVVMATASGTDGGLMPQLIEQLKRDAAEREAKARHIFEDFCVREKLAAGYAKR